MMKLKIKKGDEVVVIAGKNKGARGRVLLVQPTAMRILVEGVNIRKKAVRPSPKHPNGGIIEMEGPIHYSNVQHADKYDAKPNRTASKPAKPAAKKAAKKAKATETGNEE
ncbi:MAG: 50S ribosomal protein L24 [Ignavibacteria bacterium]|jgi:large subunit ribosomal protein L24